MSADAGTAELGDGHRVHVSAWDGGGLPVLFLNSLAADLSMWDGVRSRLSRRTVAFDARGHGRSEVIAGDCSIEDLARDALAVMDETGLERAVLCGLSLGGATAMAMAAMAPDRVAGLVLANTAVTFPPPAMWHERAAKARAGGFRDLVDPTLSRWLTEAYMQANPENTKAVRMMIAATSPEGYAACCAALAAADLTGALQSHDGPVLLIAGAHDQSTPVARAEEMRALRPGAELAVLKAAHLSSVEAGDEFAALLEGFAARLEGETAHG